MILQDNFRRLIFCVIGLALSAVAMPTLFAQAPMISVGSNHTLALRSDGTVLAWGSDENGKLGAGRPQYLATPSVLAGLPPIAAVGAGRIFSLAVGRDGSLWTWGSNLYWQLGAGSASSGDATSPVRVEGIADVISACGGLYSSVALTRDGSVWIWGSAGLGEYGDGTSGLRTRPKRLTSLTDVVAVTCANSSVLALKRDGTAWAWGSASWGEIGDGALGASRPTPSQVKVSGRITAISSGKYNGMALTDDGSVWEWGREWSVDRANPTPRRVLGPGSAVAIGGGGAQQYAVHPDQTNWWKWGSGNAPVLQSPIAQGIRSIGGIETNTVLLRKDGIAMALGSNSEGLLGDGTTVDRFSELREVIGLSGAISISVSYDGQFVLAVDETGRLWNWGSDVTGQLGRGAVLNSSVPIVVAGLPKIVQVSAGEQHSLAVDIDGNAWAWGGNRNAQLGDGSQMFRSSPVRISGLTNVRAVVAGYTHSLAIRQDGTLWAWGSNYAGELGIGTLARQRSPVQVSSLANVVAAAAYLHSVAVRADGKVFTWGDNAWGQLGLGTVYPDFPSQSDYLATSVPREVPSLSNVDRVTASTRQTTALLRNGTVWAWGGFLSGSASKEPNPSRIANLADIVGIASGRNGSLAVTRGGEVYGWGINEKGELGRETAGFVQTPVLVPVQGVAVSATGSALSMFLRTDGYVFAGGSNLRGEQGDGTYAERRRFVLVSGVGGTGYLNLNAGNVAPPPADATVPFSVRSVGDPTAINVNLSTLLQVNQADVGTTGNVYAFALAPASLVKGAQLKGGAGVDDPAYHINLKTTPSPGLKDGPLACVLAQLNSAGQLTAVSASNLQAYVAGVLAAGGTAVNVLNNISAAAIQGSTFYVGYGSSGAGMINSGVNRSVATIPGTQTCQPQAPQTGWWWDPTQRDRGYGIEVRGNNLQYMSFINNPNGTPSWTVASGPIALDGSLFQATLYSYANGQTLTGAYTAPTGPTNAGLISIFTAFSTQSTMITPAGSRSITRMEFMPSGLSTTPPINQPESGWWWNTAEPGRGYFIEWQNGYASVTGYMYDEAGKPIWYQSMAPTTDPRIFNGTLSIFGGGYPLTQSGSSINRKMARLTDNFQALSIRFSDASNGTLTLPSGRTIAITRLRF